jgi:hypothetical protein
LVVDVGVVFLGRSLYGAVVRATPVVDVVVIS